MPAKKNKFNLETGFKKMKIWLIRKWIMTIILISLHWHYINSIVK